MAGNYKVYLGNDGFIHGDFFGDQKYETIKSAANEIDFYIKKNSQQHKPVLVLIDISKVVKQDSGARRAGLEGLRGLHYDKWAMFGSNLFIKYVANFVAKATGRGDKIKVFTKREEAESWLKL